MPEFSKGPADIRKKDGLLDFAVENEADEAVIEKIIEKTTGGTSGKTTNASEEFSPAGLTKYALHVTPDVVKDANERFGRVDPRLLAAFLNRTTTQLAQGAIQQLNSAGKELMERGMNAITSRNLAPGRVMGYLERRVKIGEVLNRSAAQWDDDIVADFSEALNIEASENNVMDVVVSLAILNDPDLEDELRVEHMADPTEETLLQNRRVVWQYPPPGTPLDPPYLVMVAVEYQDMSKADDVIDSIVGQLVTHQGFKVPQTALSQSRRFDPRNLVARDLISRNSLDRFRGPR